MMLLEEQQLYHPYQWPQHRSCSWMGVHQSRHHLRLHKQGFCATSCHLIWQGSQENSEWY